MGFVSRALGHYIIYSAYDTVCWLCYCSYGQVNIVLPAVGSLAARCYLANVLDKNTIGMVTGINTIVIFAPVHR